EKTMDFRGLRIDAIINPELLSEFFCWLHLTFGNVAARQPPGVLATKWHCQEFTQCEFVFVAIRCNANRDVVLRHITAQRAMEFVPPAKNRAPIGIGLPLHDGMMDPMHARSDDDHVQNPFDFDWEPPVGMMKECRGLQGDE